MKKISLIIPVYNSERDIDNLMNSVLKQTFTNYEIVFVNDGSTDKTLEILNGYKQKCNNIKIITTENNGPGIARKIGFQHAEGELLFFVDSDDQLYNNDVLEKISEIYDETNFELLCFDVILKQGGKEIRTSFFEEKKVNIGKNDIKFLDKYVLNGTLWCKVFVKKKMKAKYFCKAFNFEDFYITYFYLNNCNSFHYINQIFYCSNRDCEGSLSKKQDVEKIKNTIKVLEKIYNSTKYKGAVAMATLKYYYFLRKILKSKDFTKVEKRELKSIIYKLNKVINLKELLKQHIDIKTMIKIAIYIFDCKISRLLFLVF